MSESGFAVTGPSQDTGQTESAAVFIQEGGITPGITAILFGRLALVGGMDSPLAILKFPFPSWLPNLHVHIAPIFNYRAWL